MSTGSTLEIPLPPDASLFASYLSVPLLRVRPFPNQPRTYFDKEELENLSRSIGAFGQIVPVIVKKVSDDPAFDYELCDGQRRWHACGIAGKPEIKIIIEDPKTEKEQFLLSVLANFGRAEHTPIEIAYACKTFRNEGKTLEQIADIFAKSVNFVSKHLSFLRLHPDVINMMSPEIPEDKRLLPGSALTLLDLPHDMQVEVAKHIVENNLQLKHARAEVHRRADKAGINRKTRDAADDYKNLKAFVARILRDGEFYTDTSKSQINRLFERRKSGDRQEMRDLLDKAIQGLQSLRAKLDL
jgi:ParB family chromosome partitioning protein